MKRAGTMICVLVLIACEVAAQAPLELSHPANCDPEKLMQGFHPLPEKRVTVTAEKTNWLLPPNTTWSYQHTRELVPTKQVDRGTCLVALPKARKQIDKLKFDDYTDAVIVLHKGRIVYEHYARCMRPETCHLLFSASKSFVGLVAAVMISEGVIDENAPVSQYVPELAHSAYGNATIRQVMDMRVDVKFLEDYTTNPQSDIRCIRCYLAAANWWIPGPQECQGQSNLYEALQNLKESEQSNGKCVRYKSPNADVLAWVVSKVSGKSLSELVSELIWSKIGTDRDAYYLVDRLGKEAAFGGLNVTLRDFARFGEMMRQMGNWNGQQVVPKSVVEDITNGGDHCKAIPDTDKSTVANWSYRSQWWVMNNPNGAYMARGVYGQRLYIDPKARMVVAKFGSNPVPGGTSTDEAYQSVLDALATCLESEDKLKQDNNGALPRK